VLRAIAVLVILVPLTNAHRTLRINTPDRGLSLPPNLSDWQVGQYFDDVVGHFGSGGGLPPNHRSEATISRSYLISVGCGGQGASRWSRVAVQPRYS
jgi:hypothetical protein